MFYYGVKPHDYCLNENEKVAITKSKFSLIPWSSQRNLPVDSFGIGIFNLGDISIMESLVQIQLIE